MERNKKRVALIGCGNLGAIIARGIVKDLSEAWTLSAVTDVATARAEQLARETGAVCVTNIAALLKTKPDVVIEATAPAILKTFAREILLGGADLMPLSIGAFADDAFFAALRETAESTGRRVYVVSGAIGGFDVMRSAMCMGDVSARIVNVKSPEALAGAPYLDTHPVPADREQTVFSGSAREAIAAFPKNVNVAVALAVATAGVDATEVVVKSVPGKKLNLHTVELSGAFGSATVSVESVPTAENPRSSAIAAYSVLARLASLTDPISFF